MYPKVLGFVLVALIGFTGCHNVFNKDTSSSVSDSSVNKESAVITQAKNVAVAETDIAKGTEVNTKSSDTKDSSLRYVYLTFDDGPGVGTLNCYNVCKEQGVKATFFMVGEHAKYPLGKVVLDTMNRDMRHFLFANHSYTHADHNNYPRFYGNSQEALKDFLRSQDTLHITTPIARFPGNPSWVMNQKFRSTKLTKSLAKLMDSIGYTVMGWDVEWKFNKQSHPIQSAEMMAKQVEDAFTAKNSFVKNHVVLLAHDRMFKEANYRDSLAKMISILQSKKGYIFETADQYPILKKADKKLLAVRK